MVAPLVIPRFGAIELQERVNLDVLRFMVASPGQVHSRDMSDEKNVIRRLVDIAATVDDEGYIQTVYQPIDYGSKDAYGGRAYSLFSGLQTLPHAFLDPLTSEQFDNDLQACNPSMLLGLCERHSLPCNMLRQYCTNPLQIRRRVAEGEAVDLTRAKAIINAFITDSDYKPEDEWLIMFKREIRGSVKALLGIYPQYLKLKPNARRPGGSGISFLLASLERWAVQIALDLWIENHGVCAYSFDGLRTTLRVPPEGYAAAADAFYEASGIRICWREKPIDAARHAWPAFTRSNCEVTEVFDNAFDGFGQTVRRFERTRFKVTNPMMYVEREEDTGDMLTRTEAVMKQVYRNTYDYYVRVDTDEEDSDSDSEKAQPAQKKARKGRTDSKKRPAAGESRAVRHHKPHKVCLVPHSDKKKFIDRWMDDPKLRTYKRMQFLPPPAQTPADVFNMWGGFEVEKVPAPTDLERAAFDAVVLPFLREVICGDNPGVFRYVINFLANLFQEPGRPTRTALVLMGAEGSGKNRLTDLVSKMMGRVLVFKTRELTNSVFGRFANVGLQRLLLVLDELEPKETRLCYNALMDMITAEMLHGEFKGIDRPFDYPSFMRLIFTTNEDERLIRVREKDRKYQFVDVSSHKANNMAFFDELVAAINTPGVRRAFYEYLMAVDYSGFDFIADRVITASYLNAKLLGVRREVSFLRHVFIQEPRCMLTWLGVEELFEEFKGWNRSKGAMGACEEYASTLQSFGILLSKLPGYQKNPHKGKNTTVKFEPEAILRHLKTLEVVSDTEVEWMLKCIRAADEGGCISFEEYCEKKQRREKQQLLLSFA